jgi:hypothetical protein
MFTLKITVKARYGHEQMPSERTVSQSTVRSRTDAVRADREHTRRRKIVPVHAMKAYSGRGGIPPLSLSLDARWK